MLLTIDHPRRIHSRATTLQTRVFQRAFCDKCLRQFSIEDVTPSDDSGLLGKVSVPGDTSMIHLSRTVTAGGIALAFLSTGCGCSRSFVAEKPDPTNQVNSSSLNPNEPRESPAESPLLVEKDNLLANPDSLPSIAGRGQFEKEGINTLPSSLRAVQIDREYTDHVFLPNAC